MVAIEELYLLNLVVTIILTVATLYRIKIEKEAAKATIEELRLKRKMKVIRDTLIRERSQILEMQTAKDIRELYDFLLESLKDDD